MTDALVSGLLAGYGVAIPVGAVAVLVVSLSARTSLVVGAAAALGVAAADGLYALAAVLGGAALARLVEPVAVPLRWLAAVVLLALAARTAATALGRRRGPVQTGSVQAGSVQAGSVQAGAGETTLGTPGRAFAALLGLTLLNPMTIVYFGALVLGRQAAGPLDPAEAAVFVVAALAASASWQLLLAGGGSLAGRVLTGPRGRLVTALASSSLIAVLAAALLAG
ncbi:MAG TPA: LysE family transporter [Micromonosporaceae bacterium]|nr:LysE family transporter [Micromonosporaceae bacterium]